MNKVIIDRAIALLREGMESTGTSTLHYQKMSEAIECLGGGESNKGILDTCGKICATRNEYETARCQLLVGHQGQCLSYTRI